MIKRLEDINLRSITQQFKDEIYKKVDISALKKIAERRAKFGVAYSTTHGDNIAFFLDTPRELRHPDEYGGEDEVYDMFGSSNIIKFDKAEREIFNIIEKFEKKYPKIRFDVVGDASGNWIFI